MSASRGADDHWNGLRQRLRNALSEGSTGPSQTIPVSIPSGAGELTVRWHQALCLLPGYDDASPVHETPPYGLLVRRTRQLRERFALYRISVQALDRDYGWPAVSTPDSAASGANADDLYLIGNALLVAPVLGAGAVSRAASLPVGRWYDYWNDAPHEGGRCVAVCAPLERLPLFVRGGAALPLRGFAPGQPTLCLRVYAGDGESAIYEDGGLADDYAQGNYRWVYITCRMQARQFSITRRVAGRYEPPYSSFTLDVIGLPGPPSDVQVDRRSAPVWYYEGGRLELTLPDDASEVEITA